MSYHCFKCGIEIKFSSSSASSIGRTDCCPKCNTDLQVCKNCLHYDPSIYNQCKEVQAERVVEKDRANFCDYFKFCDTNQKNMHKNLGTNEKSTNNQLKRLDDLFK